jgi:hypothetical protein
MDQRFINRTARKNNYLLRMNAPLNVRLRKRRAARAIATAFALCCAIASLPASAQHDGVSIKRPFRGERPMELNLHAGLSHRGPGPAAGARVAIPILDNGFVSSINNAIYITIGGDLLFERCFGGCGRRDDDYGVALAVPLTGRWQFNFTPRWSAYGEVGPNLYLHSRWFDDDGKIPGPGRHPDAWLALTVGGKWHFAPRTSLTLSLGAPYSHVGLDILL